MSDYGIKSSKNGVDVFSAVGKDILMDDKFPFAKIDPTRNDSLRTTKVTFSRNTTSNTTVQFASFTHGYDYRPQVWGIWDIVWGPTLATTPGQRQNGYGFLVNTTGVPTTSIWYEWDATNVYLYVNKGESLPTFPSDITGTVATLTTYIFADDLTTQSYN